MVTALVIISYLVWWTWPSERLPATIKVFDAKGILLYEQASGVGSRREAKYEDIPESYFQALIAAEDRSFWTNPGIDVGAIMRSTLTNTRSGKILSGASTITQQAVRSAMLPEITFKRRNIISKIREAVMAMRLSIIKTKKEILLLHANSVYFGNNVYGIRSASNYYFGKEPINLSLSEGAILVGILANPEMNNPIVNLENAMSRRAYVLGRMLEEGYILEDQKEDAEKEPIFLASVPERKSPYFVDYVLEQFNYLQIDTRGKGVVIHTTLDQDINELASDIARVTVEQLGERHSLTNASLVLLQNDNGAVRAMAGGVDYYDATHSGQVNVATSLRQPGSTLKPFIYALALSRGETAATVINDVKKVYQTKKGEGFAPNNYDGTFRGPVLLREALASSLNVPAVEMLNRIGVESFIDTLHNFGISSLTDSSRFDLSLVLGGGEVTLLELTNAYATLARRAYYFPAYAISEIIEEKTDRVLFTQIPALPKPVLGKNGESIAFLISDILSDPQARMLTFGEKNPLNVGFPAAVKTGTTTDWHDNWTVGYTPEFTIGVWVGNNDNTPMREITGIVGAAPIWNQFLTEILKGKAKTEFVRPQDIIDQKICKLTGELDDGICPETVYDKFISGTEPKTVSTLHQKVRIDTRNGLLANSNCLMRYIQEKVIPDWPTELFPWAKETGQELLPTDYSPLCSPEITKENPDTVYRVAIISPRNGAVFETAPETVANEAIVFELNAPGDQGEVAWLLDGREIATERKYPFSTVWKPVPGNHILTLKGQFAGKLLESDEVHFSVREYKSGY
jgi:penicillin-binding protein 1C